MASERWHTVRKWARRRRRGLLIGGVALALAAIAAYLIHDIATEPVVGSESDTSDPFAAPTATPSLPPPGTDLGSLDPSTSGLPTEGPSIGCDASNFTVSYTSDAPIAIGGYLYSGGEQEYSYFPAESTGSATVQQCATSPTVLIIVQAGPSATTLTCTATENGRTVETRTVTDPYGVVHCFA